MTDERNLRQAEFQRLRRQSYWITGSAIAVSSWMFSSDRMIGLALGLTRQFSLSFDVVAWVVTPIFFFIPIAGIILITLAVKNSVAVTRLGCVECASPRPFAILSFQSQLLILRITSEKNLVIRGCPI